MGKDSNYNTRRNWATMSTKHKEAILEILKKSGPIQGSVLKERILAKLHIEDNDYPKSTYLHHLEQLIDDFKIEFKKQDNKKIYYIKEFEHETPGGLIIDNLEGRISVSKILKPFNPKLSQGFSAADNKNDIHFYFEFNSTNLCLSIHKDAVPFKLHISRKVSDNIISDETSKLFGGRVITLEMPIAKISSFKDSIKSGHVLIEIIDSKKITLTDLSATNPAAILIIKNLTPELFFKEASLSGAKTVHNDWVEKNKEKMEQVFLKNKEKCEIGIPTVIRLTGESSLYII
jgi:hypothetical protein